MNGISRSIRNLGAILEQSGKPISGHVCDMAADEIDHLEAEIKQLKATAEETEPCRLVHCRCGACGTAIHEDGGCGCTDNKHHPVSDLHRDRITELRAKVEELEKYIEEINQLGLDLDLLS